MKVVVINCFDTYQHRVDFLSTFFHTKGWSVTKLTSDFSHRTKSTIDQPKMDCIYLPAKPYQKNLSIARIRSHHGFAQDCKRWLDHQSKVPDLLWVLLPPNSLAKVCAQYKREHSGVKLIFDLIDLWPETFPMGGVKWLPPFYAWRQLRDQFLPEADHVVTECHLFQRRLGLEATGSSTIYMCQQNADEYKSHPNPTKDHLSLCYLGSVNHIIDIDAIASLISQLKRTVPVKLHIIGSGEKLEGLVEAASAAGAEIECHGVIYDRAEKQRIFDQCHFGLNMMKSSVCVGLTMKSVDYLAGGLPLLNTIPGDTWELVHQYHAGLNWHAGEQIDLSAVDRTAMGENARRLFECELSDEQLYQRIEAVIGQVGL